MLGGRNVLFNHWLPEANSNGLQVKRDSVLQSHPCPPKGPHNPAWAVLLQPLPHSLHSSYQAPQISFFLLLVIFPPKQNTSHRSSNFMYFSHSQNTMQKNFRVIAEGFVPSSHGKSVGIGILLHFILDIWPLRIFSSLLVLVYCKLHCNSPSTLWGSKEELFLGASRPWGQCLIIIALL